MASRRLLITTYCAHQKSRPLTVSLILAACFLTISCSAIASHQDALHNSLSRGKRVDWNSQPDYMDLSRPQHSLKSTSLNRDKIAELLDELALEPSKEVITAESRDAERQEVDLRQPKRLSYNSDYESLKDHYQTIGELEDKHGHLTSTSLRWPILGSSWISSPRQSQPESEFSSADSFYPPVDYKSQAPNFAPRDEAQDEILSQYLKLLELSDLINLSSDSIERKPEKLTNADLQALASEIESSVSPDQQADKTRFSNSELEDLEEALAQSRLKSTQYSVENDKYQPASTEIKRSETKSEGNLTTLLEDEDQAHDITTTTTTKTETLLTTGAPRTGNSDNDSLTTVSSYVESATSASGGVASGKKETQDKSKDETKETENGSDKDLKGSMFTRMYKRIRDFLPFMNQIAILKDPSGNSTTSTTETIETRNNSSSESNKTPQKSKKQLNEDTIDKTTIKVDKKETKPRVSVLIKSKNEKKSEMDGRELKRSQLMESSDSSEADQEVDLDDNLAERMTNDKLLFSNRNVKITSNADDDMAKKARIVFSSAKDNNFNDYESYEAETRQPVVQVSPYESFVTGDEKMQSTKGNPKDLHRVSLMRQSNLVMPYKANDELVLHTTSSHERPESLQGKYIYAPTHHYYLSGASGSDSEKLVDDRSHLFSVEHTRHLSPGDQVYGAIDATRNPLYVGRKPEDYQMMLTKTNDIYFLVMVGAFCAMAIAVVLAAGLFAYRVQQNRKSTSETDYPTYGVVGPNNMNGKCGAAAFVGGYFGGSAPGSGMSNFGSKSGSAKHLADSISGDSGVASVGTIDKSMSGKRCLGVSTINDPHGANRVGKYMDNQNAARMYHYQNQKQQMITSDRASTGRHTSASDLDSEDENEDGGYTVYECPGLASAHEMEIKNPLFNDDRTP